MSWLQDNFTALLVGLLVVAYALDVVAKALKSHNRKLVKKVTEQRTEEAKARQDTLRNAADAWANAVQPRTNTDGWFALPGGKRMEFKDSGFYIQLQPDSKHGPYALHTPEDVCTAWGQSLTGLKIMGRIAATEREEFASWGGGYKP
jgi:hypothetical protein